MQLNFLATQEVDQLAEQPQTQEAAIHSILDQTIKEVGHNKNFKDLGVAPGWVSMACSLCQVSQHNRRAEISMLMTLYTTKNRCSQVTIKTIKCSFNLEAICATNKDC